MAILDRMIAASIGLIPRGVVWKVAKRYVAGETVDDAFRTIEALNAAGCRATVDHLGEFIEELGEAEATAGVYRTIIDRIADTGADSNVSIKLTAFGLLLDPEATWRNVRALVEHARGRNLFVRIDMEDSSCTDATIAIYRRLRDAGLDNVGLVLQAYLRRTLDDVSALAPLAPSYRLCKGIYVEPEEIAFKGAEEIRASYRGALRRMLDGGSRVGIATHDEALVEDALGVIRERGLTAEHYEFQMLLGVTEKLRDRLVGEGHPLRVYVPFGRDWYGYCVRRLKENPRIGRYVFLAMLGREG